MLTVAAINRRKIVAIFSIRFGPEEVQDSQGQKYLLPEDFKCIPIIYSFLVTSNHSELRTFDPDSPPLGLAYTVHLYVDT